MGGLVLSTLLLAPGAPVPAGGQPAAGARLDENQLNQFAGLVETLGHNVKEYYVRPSLTQKELLAGAVRGLFEEVGRPVPDDVAARIEKAETREDRMSVLKEARSLLGNHPALAGSRSLFAAMNGFRHATDPICGLASPRVTTYASVDQDFGVGIELEGVTGTRWAVYMVEHRVATRTVPPAGYFGPPPEPDAIPSPAVFPWRVKRVIPGSPAQKAGVKPGDVITHFNGTEITAENVDRLFSVFAMPRPMFDARTGQPLPQDRALTFRREGGKPFSPTLKAGPYNPESAFGVSRRADGGWDCMLDRRAKIGYIRVGPIEAGLDNRSGTDVKVEEMLADLTKQGCRALILDLRWCPGGYVTPGTSLAGKFLPDGSVIARMQYTNPNSGASGDLFAPPGGGKYSKLPLVLLVGQETTGGGELIAAALKDNNRCVVIGQRTFGRATIQNAREAGFAGMQFRITVGTSLRPNGKNRQRTPESRPTDEWGVRPDDGLEVPVTADKSAELRRDAEFHALRPAESREALPFDDPAGDPYRLAALKYLREKLGPAK